MDDIRICVITGGLINVQEKSVWNAIRKQIAQIRAARNHWLETKIKLVSAEPIIKSMLISKNDLTQKYLDFKDNQYIPELTEVVIADELKKRNTEFDLITYDDLFNNSHKVEKILNQCNVIFASTTLLHDLSEMLPLIKKVKKSHHKLVIGGALTGSLYKYWKGDPLVDIMAIGYGEILIPYIVDWMNSGFNILDHPENGKIIMKEHTKFLFSGSPEHNNLDFLDTPEWSTVENYRDTKYKKIYYESVRGCPYRCNFCNYPYLFNDKRFRIKSAEKIADDWEYYSSQGVKFITCLDSLFTVPKKRLLKLCNYLIERDINIKWSCYARADDLLDDQTVELMKRAGAQHLQIGIESGNQKMLDAMNKKCTVDKNLIALQMCRKHKITSLVSLIIGYPGETEETLQDTMQFMKLAQPDFHFLATFSTRIEDVPMLNAANKELNGLETMHNPYTFAPYWKHNTMKCSKVGKHLREFNKQLAINKVSLDGALFYGNIDNYTEELRDTLLDYQYLTYSGNFLTNNIFNMINGYVDRQLLKSEEKWIKTIK